MKDTCCTIGHMACKSEICFSQVTILFLIVCRWLYTFELMFLYIHIYRVSQKECAILRQSVPYVKLYRYNPKHLYPKLNGYEDNGQISLKLWQLLHTYWLPNTYWNWQEYVVSVMLILTYLLTYSMEQSPSWEANWFCS